MTQPTDWLALAKAICAPKPDLFRCRVCSAETDDEARCLLCGAHRDHDDN
jgi:hypothetical protein